MGHVRRRKGRPGWYGQLRLADGRRREVKLPAATKAEARAMLRRLELREWERREQLRQTPLPPELAPLDAGAALLTVEEAAGLAFLGEAEIRYLVTIGELESVTPPGRRTAYIRRAAFRAWLRARRAQAAVVDRSKCRD